MHEHQVGFVNRAVEAGYRVRTALFLSQEGSPAFDRLLEKQAEILLKYLLFADEAALPESLEPDPAFVKDFQASAKFASGGLSLRTLNLKTRLFEHRCSYMIYSAVFEGLPSALKAKVFEGLKTALDPGKLAPQFAYMSALEKSSIHRTLKETMTGLPGHW